MRFTAFALVGDETEELIRRLLERVQRLESHDEQAEQAALLASKNDARREARFLALLSIVQELSAHEELSEEQFLKHFEGRVRFYQDRLLQKAEDIDPNWAGQIDERGQGDMPESESYPPLFPQK